MSTIVLRTPRKTCDHGRDIVWSWRVSLGSDDGIPSAAWRHEDQGDFTDCDDPGDWDFGKGKP